MKTIDQKIQDKAVDLYRKAKERAVIFTVPGTNPELVRVDTQSHFEYIEGAKKVAHYDGEGWFCNNGIGYSLGNNEGGKND